MAFPPWAYEGMIETTAGSCSGRPSAPREPKEMWPPRGALEADIGAILVAIEWADC